MTPVCSCRQGPQRAGEGEREHCTRCGAWTREALEANRRRHEELERAVRSDTMGNPFELR